MTETGRDADLSILLSNLGQAHVVVVGDVMLDRFVFGQVDRISPEGPIPVFQISGEDRMVGGAGNVARNLAALRVPSEMIGVVGNDASGREVADLVAAEGVDPARLVIDGTRQTTVKTRFTAAGQQMLRADQEDAGDVNDDITRRIIDHLKAVLTKDSVLVLSDYGKGVLTPACLSALIGHALTLSVPVLVDPKGRDFRRYWGATVLTPNLKELSVAAGRSLSDDDDIVTAAQDVINKSGLQALLVTRSSDGMTLVTNDCDVTHQATEAREVFDVSGAGDTVVATLAAALGAGAPLADAMALANQAAGIVVGKVGTAAVHLSDLTQSVQGNSQAGAGGKLLDQDALKDRIAVWRRQGLRVGFTNGCFDLLHPGHISLLTQAKAACDRLVLGLNSDASVRRLKGPERPVQTEVSRATVLSGLAAVDVVTLFDEDTPLALITALVPDVLIKGADYTKDEVVGADVVEAAGGRVVLAQLLDGHSTTATVGKLKSEDR